MKRRTALKAIWEKCLDCSGHQTKEIKYCPVLTCALWPFRMGRGYEAAPERSTPSKSYVLDVGVRDVSTASENQKDPLSEVETLCFEEVGHI